jgi:hypothetical protein
LSVRMLSAVWECAPYEGGALLVLLALADYANEEGECWLSARQTHNILRQFKIDGVISWLHRGGRGKSNRYKLEIKKLKSISPKPSSVNCVSVKSQTETLQSATENTAIGDSAIRKNRQEPSKEPSARSPDKNFDPVCKHCHGTGDKPHPGHPGRFYECGCWCHEDEKEVRATWRRSLEK